MNIYKPASEASFLECLQYLSHVSHLCISYWEAPPLFTDEVLKRLILPTADEPTRDPIITLLPRLVDLDLSSCLACTPSVLVDSVLTRRSEANTGVAPLRRVEFRLLGNESISLPLWEPEFVKLVDLQPDDFEFVLAEEFQHVWSSRKGSTKSLFD